MRRHLRPVAIAIMLFLEVVCASPSAMSGATSGEYNSLWANVTVALANFVEAAALPSGAAPSSDLLSKLDTERARFDNAMLKLILIEPPDNQLRHHLTVVPKFQEIGTAMVLITDGIRAHDVAATEAARDWLIELMVDSRLATSRLENSR